MLCCMSFSSNTLYKWLRSAPPPLLGIAPALLTRLSYMRHIPELPVKCGCWSAVSPHRNIFTVAVCITNNIPLFVVSNKLSAPRNFEWHPEAPDPTTFVASPTTKMAIIWLELQPHSDRVLGRCLWVGWLSFQELYWRAATRDEDRAQLTELLATHVL